VDSTKLQKSNVSHSFRELWDRIAKDPEKVGVPIEHQRILEERLKEYRAKPKAGRPWSEVREQLLAKLDRT
jgi:putative addiction module component (TIGR02574 family)